MHQITLLSLQEERSKRKEGYQKECSGESSSSLMLKQHF
ncbi:hypothetical protein EV13_2311 [Prochlorococcus sp. MIT 0702]|nr:hypothetical protein EV12_1970 [Prochlorococcus sp. MIT 0701]KGG26850.1 hypothetical protein EV13_2311 [Prochlorococcus sp. MIT 0702]KGG36125.1 hypothetical protein EV14_0534 [Prochlorococcus sp. MIT 0703]